MRKMRFKNVRLPAHVTPERYKIILRPDLNNFTFSGEETILLKLSKPATELSLHARNLKVLQGSIKGLKAKTIKYNKKAETVILKFGKKILAGKTELNLKFEGQLNDRMRGFYRSSYKVGNAERFLATTQFESTDAREAFPSFDEPSHKAIFDVSLIVPSGHTAISNTLPTKIAEHESGYKIVEFAPTPKMSTYLLAFIVGDFEYIEGKTSRGVQVRVFVTPGKKHQAKFALQCAIKTLDFFEKYFDIPYPLPVLDMIAIPDFSAGAMENWGAVTYRETALLLDEKNSSASSRQWVASVIAHELAHQWFGNLVTMEWWTHLWLNEGFASYISYLAVDHMFPEWDMWTQFVNQDLSPALRLDALVNTHPIEVEVHHPSEISEIFDQISYDKGASVIRMLANYLGEKDFRAGLSHYLKKHSYKNAKTEDLWAAFEKISKKPVKRMMQNWTKKPGYPLIRIVEKSTKLELVQKRYFSNNQAVKQDKDKTLWMVPVSLVSSASKKASKLLLEKKSTTVSKPKNLEWLKLNYGETAVARVDYPAQLLSGLKKPIKNKELPAVDRLGVLRDALALAESGDVPTAEVLKLLSAYKEEGEYTTWAKLAEGAFKIADIFAQEKFSEQLHNYFVEVFRNVAEELSWKARKNEKHVTALQRSLVLNSIGHFGHKPTIEHAVKLFKSAKPISADLRSVVYNLVAENGGEAEHKKLIQMYKAANMQEEKDRVARALGKFKQKNLLKKTLAFAISSEVKPQDTPFVIASVTFNPKGREVSWKFIKQHWQLISQKYSGGGHLLPRFISPLGEFADLSKAQEIKEFFKKHRAAGAERTIKQALENIESNAAWVARDKKPVETWLLKKR